MTNTGLQPKKNRDAETLSTYKHGKYSVTDWIYIFICTFFFSKISDIFSDFVYFRTLNRRRMR